MSYPFGKIGSTFVLVNMLVLAYGAMVAYLLIIKDTIPTILGISHGNKGGIFERDAIMLGTSLFIILPLAVQRDMASLSGTSFVSVLADVILVLFIAITAPIHETVNQAGGFGEVLKDEWINPTVFIGLGILSTAMACQHSAFIVSGSLENKTQSRWATVTFRSISIATFLCILLGVCGYLAFLENTQGDILNNFEQHAIAANIARGLLAVTMFCKFRLNLKVCIANFLLTLFKFLPNLQ
jgi:solute carrier family 38 (sodium-coupled neutral amino acid transporter), member 11